MSATVEDLKNNTPAKPNPKPLKVRIKELPWNGLITFGGVIAFLLVCVSVVVSGIWMWVTGSTLLDRAVGVGLMTLLILGSVAFQFYSGLAWGAGQTFVSVILFCFVFPMEYYNVLTGSGTLNLYVNRTVETEKRSDELYDQGQAIMQEQNAQAATSRGRAEGAPNTYMSVAGEAEERARQSTAEAKDTWDKLRELDVGGVTETIETMESLKYGTSSENRNLGLIILCSVYPALYIFFRGRIHGRRRVEVENVEQNEKTGKKP